MPVYETTRRSGCSVWQVLLAGCLGLAFLGAIGFGLMVFTGVRMATQMQQAPPANPKVVAQQFAGVPVYPGAQLDAQATGQMSQMAQVAHKTFGVFGGASGLGQSHAVYTVQATPAAVAGWYDKKMASAGWTSQAVQQRRTPPAAVKERMYQKGGSILMVMATPGGMQLTLMLGPTGGKRTP